MASLNPFRRRNQSALIASGQQVNIDDESAVQAVLKRREKWQGQAVDGFDACGELQNGVSQLSDLMSGLVTYAAIQPTDTDAKPVRVLAEDDDESDDSATSERDQRERNPGDQIAIDTVKRLGSITDVSQLLADMTSLLVILGECELLGVQPQPDLGIHRETWMAYSHLELEKGTEPSTADPNVQESVATIKDFKDGKPLILRESQGDTWIRIWRAHPVRKSKANSHVRPLLGAIDELLWWDAAAEAASKSRIALTGLIGVPSNIELPPEAGEPANLKSSQRFVRRLFNLAVKTLQNPRAASAAVPFIFSYPWNEQGKSGVESITIKREQDELLEKRTDRSLRRIAQGFPLPVESFFGLGDASQFGSREISENKWRENVEPFAKFVFAALTDAWFRPILRASGVDNWHEYMLWYDASNLVVHPDITQAADKGVEYGAINLKAWRRVRGFSERDKPTTEEKQEQLEWIRGLKGREEKPKADDADESPDEPTEKVDHQGHAPVEKKAAPARGKGQPVLASTNGHPTHSPLGRRLAEIDADLLTRVHVMADSSMRRAQEKAGFKLKNRAGKNQKLKQSLRGVGAEDVAHTLGREAVVTLGMDDLFSDCFESVPTLFTRWCDKAAEASFAAAGLLPDHRKDAAFQLASGTDEAAQYLVRELRAHAATLLFDRAGATIPQPEGDDLLVPTSIVRKALSVAGGSPNKQAGLLLLATGPAVSRSLAEVGHFAKGHSWWYGPALRSPHKAHERMDGQPINLSGPLTAAPGDVPGCSCLAVPEFE